MINFYFFICGPSEYHPFISISAVFGVLGKGFSYFFKKPMNIQFELYILCVWK